MDVGSTEESLNLAALEETTCTTAVRFDIAMPSGSFYGTLA